MSAPERHRAAVARMHAALAADDLGRARDHLRDAGQWAGSGLIIDILKDLDRAARGIEGFVAPDVPDAGEDAPC